MHNSSEQPNFIKTQYQFAAHIRDPETNPPPTDVEARRMAIYSELFYNNVEDFMSNSFPVIRKITKDVDWHRMVRDYFANHLSHTPLFPEMPREFLKYLESEREPQPEDPPFLLELAHYEWVELALTISDQEINLNNVNHEGDLLQGTPVISPLAWPFSYSYPVHQIGPDFIPKEAGTEPTYLVVYRNRQDEVGFLKLNPVTAHLLQLIMEDTQQTGIEMLTTISKKLNHPNPDAVIQGGLQTLHDLRTRDIILGVKNPA